MEIYELFVPSEQNLCLFSVLLLKNFYSKNLIVRYRYWMTTNQKFILEIENSCKHIWFENGIGQKNQKLLITWYDWNNFRAMLDENYPKFLFFFNYCQINTNSDIYVYCQLLDSSGSCLGSEFDISNGAYVASGWIDLKVLGC